MGSKTALDNSDFHYKDIIQSIFYVLQKEESQAGLEHFPFYAVRPFLFNCEKAWSYAVNVKNQPVFVYFF